MGEDRLTKVSWLRKATDLLRAMEAAADYDPHEADRVRIANLEWEVQALKTRFQATDARVGTGRPATRSSV